ncbi:MAG: transcription initiation factor sigma 70 [Parcubacteria group bacterium GW2011_GWC1_38_6]|nr:MAG: transcription initiation factor sigma 70 [Parcubacteria group bacterium GW2011_GWC1_38_6]
MRLTSINEYIIEKSIMAKINFQTICSDLIKNLPDKGKEVIVRRFGLDGLHRETLDAIGQDHGITRERVRQIQEVAMSKIDDGVQKYQSVFDGFEREIRSHGGLKKESILLGILGDGDNQNQVFFLLTLGKPFARFTESDDFHTFWTTEQKPMDGLKKTVSAFYKFLNKNKKPISLQDTSVKKDFGKNLKTEHLQSYLEVSKNIQSNQENLWGLKEWPEINPRGIKDRAYLAFKKEQRPLHFQEVARLIGDSANIQSVHNELIRDARFVLVGRGLYALKEMGYMPGVVKDVIMNILKKSQKPLTPQEIVAEVSKQRIVKENTILINLNNKKFFLRNQEGKYSFVKGVRSI